MFNPRDMSPLAGEALAETIRQLELQNKFGVEEEFEGCCCGEEGINIKHFLDGSCAMTYNWGDNYKIHFSEDSKVGGLVGAEARECWTVRLESLWTVMKKGVDMVNGFRI